MGYETYERPLQLITLLLALAVLARSQSKSA